MLVDNRTSRSAKEPAWEWAEAFSFVSHGVAAAVRSDDAAVLARVRDHLPPDVTPAPRSPCAHRFSVMRAREAHGARERFDVLRASPGRNAMTRIARAVDREEALLRLESALHLTVATAAPDHLFVHAGVVAWQGVAIVIPGRSHSGKSCLVAALVRSGASYYSDEYAVFDAGGHVHPYPKALSLRSAGGAPPVRMTAEMLGGSGAAEPLPVGIILITRFNARAVWRPRPVSAGIAVLRLLENTVAARARPEAALTILPRVASHSRTLMGRRGSATEVARALLEDTTGGVRPDANPRVLS